MRMIDPDVRLQIMLALYEIYGSGFIQIQSAYYWHTARNWDLTPKWPDKI